MLNKKRSLSHLLLKPKQEKLQFQPFSHLDLLRRSVVQRKPQIHQKLRLEDQNQLQLKQSQLKQQLKQSQLKQQEERQLQQERQLQLEEDDDDETDSSKFIVVDPSVLLD